jgi:leucyl aminopeptidase (aminopeptidase T)
VSAPDEWSQAQAGIVAAARAVKLAWDDPKLRAAMIRAYCEQQYDARDCRSREVAESMKTMILRLAALRQDVDAADAAMAETVAVAGVTR